MYINQGIAVQNESILLVPYEAYHVETYHGWMQDKELQELTASEPLSLEEEYAMQKTWRKNNNMLTFIVCQAAAEGEKVTREHERMIGDINLFLYDDHDDNLQDDVKSFVGEIELMIAVPSARGKGLGLKILQTFLAYIIAHEQDILLERAGRDVIARLAYLRVKISKTNTRSIALFERSGFKKISPEPNYFDEFELRLPASLTSRSDHMDITHYREFGYVTEAAG